MYWMYGALEAWFDKTWKLNDFVLVSDGKVAKKITQRIKHKQATNIPKKISAPDRVETRIGTLNFFDGIPTD